ncbi:MAG TPA: hypothetical protein VFC74_01130 [Oscillospiraceae bacterium]|nr:hypothetical protein [Oscillospiraceae bacterium]
MNLGINARLAAFYLKQLGYALAGKPKVQAVFDLVIEQGFYPTQNKYMCNAIIAAYKEGHLPRKAAAEALREVEAYVESLEPTKVYACTLFAVYREKNLSYCPEVQGVEIFSDWKNRPLAIA